MFYTKRFHSIALFPPGAPFMVGAWRRLFWRVYWLTNIGPFDDLPSVAARLSDLEE